MLTDSERFAFVPRRLHGFATTGNAYDACQCDEAIGKGDTLIVLSESVVGIAWTWPIAVTATNGALHQIKDDPRSSLAELAATFDMRVEDVSEAVALAQALGFALDPVFHGAIAPG